MKPSVLFRKPPPLRPGDPIRIVAPSGRVPREAFEAGLKVLSARYRPVLDEGLFAQHRYLAGKDERRLEELSAALQDTEAGATFCARGGYGAMRLLPELPRLKSGLRPFVGFSDITAVHLALNAQGWVTFHGPVVTQLGRHPASVAERLFHLLEATTPAPPLTNGRTLVPGLVEGPLLGGNLSVLSRLIGTPFLPPLDGAILLLEDVGEAPYRLDRMWTHLALAGVFKRVKGVVLGDFTDCEEKDAAWSSAQVLEDLAKEANLPCAGGFRIGHGDLHYAVPLGVRVRLNATGANATLEQLEAAVDPGARA